MTLRRRFALFLTVAITAMIGGTGATAAQATGTTICVALVVDGTPLGSNVSTGCAKVSKGATGIDVLEAAGHTVGFRSDGLVCTIDGLPKTGCAAVDDSHFWAYFHRAPGKTTWTYSTEGPSTYRPANASTEGWVYRDGTTATPANVPYSQICTTKPTPSASPSPAHTPTHHPSTAPTPRHHPHSAAPSPSPTASASPTRNRPHRRHHQHHQKSPRQSGPVASATPTISPSSAALVGGTTSPPGGGGSSTGLIIGVIAVLLLGGAAAYRFRRSAGRP